MDEVTKKAVDIQNRILDNIMEVQFEKTLEELTSDESFEKMIREKHFAKGVPITYQDSKDPNKVITEYPNGEKVVKYV